MKQVFVNLLVNIIAGFWMSLKVAQCQNLAARDHEPYCYGTSSPKICFTTLPTNTSHPVREPYKEASRRCKASAPGSSLIVINSLASQRAVESFIMRQLLETETIITDARMLSETESRTWSWVNGNPYYPDVSNDVINTTEQFHDAACVELDHDRQSLSYCFENASLKYRFICEYPEFSYDDNRRYSPIDGLDTWYDARKNCLRSRGDLISLMDRSNRTVKKFSWLKKTHKYWIGLHRNTWIWNSTGAAVTYTNWNNGFPDDSSDKQCICFHPRCRTENESSRPICEVQNDRKWMTCNCSNSYAIVCQSEEKPPIPGFTTTIRTVFKTIITGATTSSTTSSRKPEIPMTTVGTTKLSSDDRTNIIDRKIASTSPMTPKPSNNSFEHKPTKIATHSADGVAIDVTGFNTTGILIIVLLIVAVAIIIVAVILFIRKRRHGRRNEGSPVKITKQDVTVSCVYATVVADNRPSDDTAPAGNTIYAEPDMIQRPMPSSNTIYATVQPTTEAIGMGGNVVYAELDVK